MAIQSTFSETDRAGRLGAKALCICCFGRGGSSLLWHLLGSSTDVWMMQREWHKTVFGGMTLLRKSLRMAMRKGYLERLGNGDRLPDRIAQSFMRNRVESGLVKDEGLYHPDARLIGMKVMDYNIFWHDGIQRAFGGGHTVVLMRRPVPQCESLMRSGLTLEQACEKYNEVSGFMAELATRPGSVPVRFDDFLADPTATMSQTCAALNIAVPDSYVAKVKPYGAKRQAGTDISQRNLRSFPKEGLRNFVDPSVDETADTRLSEAQKTEIRARTGPTAEKLGY